jgi:enoyl-CoA hydratase/carnithine racemase
MQGQWKRHRGRDTGGPDKWETIMSADHIQTSREGAVLTVTIANEARRNAIGTAALDRLDELADEIASGDARAVILTGAGDKAFTSGFDLSELGDFKPENFLRSRFSDVFEKWARLPVPVIGALNGHCMGGGVHVAVACDALVSAPGVRFMIPAARFGFVYVPASIRRIKAALGPSRAAQLLYLNQEFIAEDLTANGFVQEVTVDVMAAARNLAENAATLAPLAVAAMKEIIHEGPDQPRIEALVEGCAFSEDVVEGLAAMREKRTPMFKGC